MPEEPSRQLDLRGTPCPMNFVRIKLELDKLPTGAELDVAADGGDTGRDILRSLDRQDYRVTGLWEEEDSIRFTVSGPSE